MRLIVSALNRCFVAQNPDNNLVSGTMLFVGQCIFKGTAVMMMMSKALLSFGSVIKTSGKHL